jgi:uncharacterized protein (DUF362 family)
MLTRREWLGAASSLLLPSQARSAPTSPVAVARCGDYGPAMPSVLKSMFDQLGGLGRLVRNKTVGIKVNLTGSPRERLGLVPAERCHYTHPAIIGATVRLLGEAGASRVRILEGAYSSSEPLEEFMYDTGWDPSPLLTAAARVDMENTNVLGKSRRYHRLSVPGGGFLYDAFDFNHSYDECDVLVSIAKLKEHATCGVTMSLKNMFGATPVTIYGDGAGKDEPSLEAVGGRGQIFHSGRRQPPRSAPQEKSAPAGTPASDLHNDKWRIPRIVTDICAARPIHLAIIDGVETMAGGEGPWLRNVRHVKPGVLIAGLNPVCTDAVGTALMGFDPMATRGSIPFEKCESTLELCEKRGLGTRDLRRIEVIGPALTSLAMNFRRA